MTFDPSQKVEQNYLKKPQEPCFSPCPWIRYLGTPHRFPPLEFPIAEKFNLWKSVLSDTDKEKGDAYIFNNIRICDHHFENFYITAGGRLTRNAIPTLNIASTSKSSEPSEMHLSLCSFVENNTSSAKDTSPYQDEHIDMENDRISSHSPSPIDTEQNFECWRYKLTNIFDSAKLCGLCAENDEGMLPVHECLEIGVKEWNLKNTWSEIVQEVFHGQDVLLNKYICEKCSDKLIQAYLFINTTKRVAKIMTDYVNNLHSKMIPLTSHLCENPSVHSRVFIILNNDDAGDFNPEILSTEYAANLNSVDDNGSDKENNKSEFNKLSEEVDKTNDSKEERNDNELHTIAADDNLDEIFHVDENNDNELQTTETEDTLDKMFGCTFCSKSFTTNEHLTAHYETHSKVDCPYCAMIVSENELVEHLKQNHEHHNFFLCEPCNIPYYTEIGLIVHMKENHPQKHAKLKKKCILCLETVPRSCKNHTCRFRCPDCFEVPCVHYKYLISFREQSFRHIRKVKCLDCEYVCRNKLNLVSHVNREHLNHHPYICDKCGEKFHCKRALKRHIVKFH